MPTLKTRIKNRIDSQANWDASTDVPLTGEILVYNTTPPQVKVGDGVNLAKDLPIIAATPIEHSHDYLPLSGNAYSATKLLTPRTISLTGSVTASGNFDGSDNLNLSTKVTYLNNAYTTRLTSMNFNTKNINKMFYTVADVGKMEAAPPEDSIVLTMPWDTNGWAVLLALEPHNNPDMFIRGSGNSSDNNSVWDASWKTILNSGNFSSYALPLTGGTMKGNINMGTDTNVITLTYNYGLKSYLSDKTTSTYIMYVDASNRIHLGYDKITSVYSQVPLYGAVWNDYAEFRISSNSIKPGYIVCSNDAGILSKTSVHLSPYEGVVTDTFGFAIGETDTAKTPLAVAGRVLVYTEEPRENYHAGDVICAGPHGKADKMTREEAAQYPDRIVGTVSEIPDYEVWGSGNVKVNGRIWINVK